MDWLRDELIVAIATLRRLRHVDRPDASTAHHGILPPGNGTILRVIDYPPEPETRAEFEEMARATFRAIYPDVAHDPADAPHAGMHYTNGP